MDGTFDHTPALFKQLYTIHGTVRKSNVPCVYLWLPNKTEAGYLRAVQQLKKLKVCIHTSVLCTLYDLVVISQTITSIYRLN